MVWIVGCLAGVAWVAYCGKGVEIYEGAAV